MAFLVISDRGIAQACGGEVRKALAQLDQDYKRNKAVFCEYIGSNGSLGKLGPLLSGAEDLMTKDMKKVKLTESS